MRGRVGAQNREESEGMVDCSGGEGGRGEEAMNEEGGGCYGAFIFFCTCKTSQRGS